MKTQKQLSDRRKVAKDEPRCDYLRPSDPNIPFFSSRVEYDQHPKPYAPAGYDLETMVPWLIQPGLNSIEVQEAIFRVFFGKYKSFSKYICEAAIVQPGQLRKRTWERRNNRPDFSKSERRDVCFLLLSGEENEQLLSVLREYDLQPRTNLWIVTPYDKLRFIQLIADPERHVPDAHKRLLGYLWLYSSTFALSTLPSGVQPIEEPVLKCYRGWRFPKQGAKTSVGGLATCDAGFERIHWICLNNRESMILPIRERSLGAPSSTKDT